MSRSEISASVYNEVVDEVTTWYAELVDFLTDNLLGDGYPPFTQPLGEREQFDLLNAWRMAGDPRYWNDQAAQQAFARLAVKFQPPSPYGVPPAMQMLGVA